MAVQANLELLQLLQLVKRYGDGPGAPMAVEHIDLTIQAQARPRPCA